MNQLNILKNPGFFKMCNADLIKLSLKLTKGLLTSEEAGIFLQEYDFIHISISTLQTRVTLLCAVRTQNIKDFCACALKTLLLECSLSSCCFAVTSIPPHEGLLSCRLCRCVHVRQDCASAGALGKASLV